jgi:hypothetical protein
MHGARFQTGGCTLEDVIGSNDSWLKARIGYKDTCDPIACLSVVHCLGCCCYEFCPNTEGLKAGRCDQLKLNSATDYQPCRTALNELKAALVHVTKALGDGTVLWGLVNNAGILPLGFVEACPVDNYRLCM